MHLHLLHSSSKGHNQLACAVSWNSSLNEVFSGSDDQSVQRWNVYGEPLGKACLLDTSLSDVHCHATSYRKQQTSGTDVFAVACTDGTLKLINTNGRLEKSVDAHRGAVLCVRWSPDGSTIATSGEDGQVKLWSRAGMLRCTLAQADDPVYCICWGGADADQLLFCSSRFANIKAVQGAGAASSNLNTGQTAWKAHDALVLSADWNAVTGLIVTGGEDCRFKVWDSLGRLMYQSDCWEHSITSVAWSPDGQLFAVGSYNCLALCDCQGWTYSQVRPASGSLLGLCWSPDGTYMAACGGTGCVIMAAVLDVRKEDGRVAAVLESERVISVTDMLTETKERLEFRDPVSKWSLGCGHLVACTASQCHIYAINNWNTPHISDLKQPVQLVLQCGRCFALLDTAAGIQIFTYEGRPICSLKPSGLRLEVLSEQLISLSNDTVALATGNILRCFDTAQGRAVGDAVTHKQVVKAVRLSQAGTAAERFLAILDTNNDLYLLKSLATGSTPSSSVGASSAKAVTVPGNREQTPGLVKLASSVLGPPMWHDTAPMLAAMVDGQLVVWYNPAAAFVDNDLLQATRRTHGEGLTSPGTSLELFAGSHLQLRRGDGARVYAGIQPQALLVHDLVRCRQWDKAVRLARFSLDDAIWACLAAMAISAGELATAEVACAALDAVDKLHFMLHLKHLAGAAAGTHDPVVAAEFATYKHQTDEAEAVLLQAGLLYRAIKLWVRLHKWQRALHLARKHQQHEDTVLMYRRRYLAALDQEEVLPDFQALSQVVIDDAAIKERNRQEKLNEKQLRAKAMQIAAPVAPTVAGTHSGVGTQHKKHR